MPAPHFSQTAADIKLGLEGAAAAGDTVYGATLRPRG